MKLCTAALFLLALTLSARAQAPGGMATLQVTRFSNLENQLNQAMASGNRGAAAALLTDDFEQWTPQPPGSPTPREDWLKQASKHAAGAQLRQMAVKELGNHAVADFVLLVSTHPGKSTQGRSPDKAFFIVDVWEKQGGNWRLQQRYQSAVDPAPYRRPPSPVVK